MGVNTKFTLCKGYKLKTIYSYIKKIYYDISPQSKMWCLFKHQFLVNWNIEIMNSSEEDFNFLAEIKVSDTKQSGNNADVVQRECQNYV